MKKIERFRTATLTGKCSAYNAPMIQDDNGEYVRYESHREILRGVEAELAALKAMQKSDFFYHLKPIFEKSFEEAIAIVVKQATQSVFKVNTEALISADVARWMEKHMNERAGFATGGFVVDSGKTHLDDALIKSVIVRNSASPRYQAPKNMVICTGADEGSGFTFGKKYAIDRNEGSLIRISQDDFVSDLAEDDCWIASRRRNLVTGEFRYFLQGHSEGKRASFDIVE